MAAEVPMRVLLVDDHALVRSAIRQAIEAPDVEIVGEARSAEEAIEMAARLRPDVILLDIDLPGVSGIEAVRELAPRLPETRIVMLTVSSDRRESDLAWRDDPQDGTSPLLREWGGTPGYTVLSLYAGINVAENVRLLVGVENLTDKKYRAAHSRMDAPGIGFVASLEILF